VIANIVRYGSVAVVALALVGAVWWFIFRADDLPPPRPVQEITVVRIIPPPPLPPQVQPPPPQEQKMLEQPKVVEQAKEDKPIDKPKDDSKNDKDEPPPGPLSLADNAVGPGDLFNLGGNPNGRGLFGGPGGGSRFGWYAVIVQKDLKEALEADDRTRRAVGQVDIRLWADQTGKVTKVQLINSTGNAQLDSSIRDVIVSKVTLKEPPPKDMPMPINTRVIETQVN
jgi:periplasmic protein TonB